MELFQELVFTISFSLIVSLLIAKLFAVASCSDGGKSIVPTRVDEKIEKEWVVCGSEKEEKVVGFDDLVEVSEEGGFGGELGSGVVVKGVGECYVFDEMPERVGVDDSGAGLVESDEGDVVESSGLLIQKDCVRSGEVEHESSAVVIGDCYVTDESHKRTEVMDAGVDLLESCEGNVVESGVSLIHEDCVKCVDLVESYKGNVVESGVSLMHKDCGKSVDLVERDEGNEVETVVSLMHEDCVKSVVVQDESSAVVVGDGYVLDESPKRTEVIEAGVDLVECDKGDVVESTGSLIQEDCVKSVDVQHELSAVVGDCYVFDKMHERTEVNDSGVDSVECDEGYVVESSVSSMQEDCVNCVDAQHESSAVVGDCYVLDESTKRTEVEVIDAGVDLVESDKVKVVESGGSLIKEDCVKSVEVQHESSAVVGGDSCVFDVMPERTDANSAGVDLVKSYEGNLVESGVSLIREDCGKYVDVGEVKLEEEDDVLDDDWQGIETTELEKGFGAAVAFMGSKRSADRVNLIDNDVKTELYGLHKVAIEGSCFEPQPMALKVFARANWNSWKRLENLGREDAMEQYIALLSQHVPDWIGRHASDKQ